VQIAVQVEPARGVPVAVEYRWDVDTAILVAQLADIEPGTGMSGSVELSGNDGSWLVLDVKNGQVRGVEVAVWPDVRKQAKLKAPAEVEAAKVTVPNRKSEPGVSVLQMDTALVAESDPAQSIVHFRLGGRKPARTLRIARDVLVEIDDHLVLSGVWLLNVPPFPAEE
jgi:hypothetical protein